MIVYINTSWEGDIKIFWSTFSTGFHFQERRISLKQALDTSPTMYSLIFAFLKRSLKNSLKPARWILLTLKLVPSSKMMLASVLKCCLLRAITLRALFEEEDILTVGIFLDTFEVLPICGKLSNHIIIFFILTINKKLSTYHNKTQCFYTKLHTIKN